MDGDEGDSGAGGGASLVGGGGGASLVGGGGGGSWVCVMVSGARVIVSVSGGGGGGASDAGGGATGVSDGGTVGVVVTVVDDGDGVLSLLRRTSHTATATAARTRINPPTSSPTERRWVAWYWSVCGSANCI